MHCANCAATIEKSVGRLKGIKSVSVNFAGETGTADFDPLVVSKEDIFAAVKDAGYTPLGEEATGAHGSAAEPLPCPESQSPPKSASNRELIRQIFSNIFKMPDWKKDLAWVIFTLLMAIPVVIMSYGNMFGTSRAAVTPSEGIIIALFVLATIVQFTSGLTFYRGAYYSLKNFSSNMDVLVSLGISAAYFYSAAAVFLFKGIIYFDTAVLLILFIRIGKLLEKFSRSRAASSFKALFRLQANTANLILPDGSVKEIDTGAVKPGNILLVKKGDKIPADGVVEDGETLLDESMLTGEPIPVEKKRGDEVKSATINSGDPIKIRALRVGKDTVLSQIVRMVEDAQADKAPIQRIADTVTNYFVPVVVLISMLSFILWEFVFHAGFLFALSAAIAVLVIACPCAMGLATPMALMVGSAIGLEKGILIKKASILEETARLNAIVFDKTGTITYGKPEVAGIIQLSDRTPAELLKISAAAEAFSSHPIARAIVNKFQNENPEMNINDLPSISDFKEIGGFGLSLKMGGIDVLLGKKGLFDRPGIERESFAKFKTMEEEYAGKGNTLIGIAVDNRMSGIILISDKVKEEAPEAIKKIKSMNIVPFLLTGDNISSAAAVAGRIGIDKENIIANVLPSEKLNEIKKLKNRGFKVAMVGDGINDAPALAAADVGIAIGSGTDAARETGDIILVKNDLRDSYKSIALGRKTLAKVKQNLFWAFIFNGLGIPFAAGLFYHFTGWLLPPAAAGAAMAVSSITVSLNTVLLRGFAGKMGRL